MKTIEPEPLDADLAQRTPAGSLLGKRRFELRVVDQTAFDEDDADAPVRGRSLLH